MFTRRKFIRQIGLIGALTGLSPVLIKQAFAQDDPKQLANNLHNKILTIDSHCDTPLYMRNQNFDIGTDNTNVGGSQVDFPRMKAGGLDASFFAVFVGQGARDSQSFEKAKNKALSIFTAIIDNVNSYPEMAKLAFEPEDALRLKTAGKHAIYLGLENGYPIGKEINNVKLFYDLGTRYITLCHSSNNDICDSSTDDHGIEHNGLSPFGRQVVEEMNRLGIMIDVSHISDKSFYDIAKLSSQPFIASHSCARALCNNPRNLNDAMLKKLAEKDGVIQMCILSDYVKTPTPYPGRDEAIAELRKQWKIWDTLSEERKQELRQKHQEINQKYPRKLATVSDAVDHIDHIVKLIGIDHVGIGTDFDGGGGLEDCKDASELKNITIELIKRGYSNEDIEKIWSKNFLRVFSKVRSV